MTLTARTAIDNKITELGKEGCINFLQETERYPDIDWNNCKDIRRIIRGELAAEDWDEYTNLFLNWQIA